MIFILFTFLAVANAGHWVEWMVFQRQCGTLERRCVADFYGEVNPVCPGNAYPCNNDSVTYGSWEDANSKLKNVINLQIGREFKKVPIMISGDGTKYLIFQRRINGNVDFYRKWKDYVNGFGNPEGDYWLGLRALNTLTSTGKFNMLVILTDFNGTAAYARYNIFEVNGPTEKYKLKVGNYSGTAGDAMAYHNNKAFSTFDQDNDGNNFEVSAIAYHGGWWYGQCHEANLNGKYFSAPGNHNSYGDGVNWNPFGSYYKSMKTSVMALSLN